VRSGAYCRPRIVPGKVGYVLENPLRTTYLNLR
jgi:hypothetical protein